MKIETERKFYQLYERLASMTQIVNQEFDTTPIETVLSEISAMFRLSKGVTHFYRSPAEEQRGEGETMISYDTGIEGRPVHTVRFVTRLLSITTMTVYMAEQEEPLNDEELAKVDLTMRTVLTFISRNRLQTIAEELAFFDDDGFCNLRSFFNYFSWQTRPDAWNGMAALNYNLRHFSLVNEEYGRDVGDVVLKNHYRHIVSMIGADGIVSRLGGDSFACICKQSLLPELLDYLTEAAVPFDENGNTVTVTACAGVFKFPDGYVITNPNDVMGKILHAYRIAQNGGHDHIIFYDDRLLAAKEHAMRIQKKFPQALRNGEFHVFYQPKVNTTTGELCGAEALCRWFHEGCVISPSEFIPVLEQTSDICKLDFYMLDLVCGHIRKWLDEGRKVVRISVNLSRKHMLNAELLKTIMNIVDGHHVPHEYIEIELTETTTDVEFKDLKRVVDALQREHMFTSVDDFGMGYSSLNLIRVVPWNVLKVDRIFLPMDDEKEDSIRNIMFKYVVAMAKELGLECIVEGVETPAQLEILRKNDCELAQGFLFDKPLPVQEFEKRLDMHVYPLEKPL